MTMNGQRYNSSTTPDAVGGNPTRQTVLNYERELKVRMDTEVLLRKAIADDAALIAQKDLLIGQLELLSQESDHRLLNGLQLIASLITLQSRGSANAEVAAQLAIAADRVAMIGHLHRRLHSLDGVPSVAFKRYLEDLYRDCAAMLTFEHRPALAINLVGADLELPTQTAIPLGYIVNELITNAAKHGDGKITVRLEENPGNGYALSVSNGGPCLPEGFDPSASKGLGMKIVLAFVDRLGGELLIGRGIKNEGSKFTVLFA